MNKTFKILFHLKWTRDYIKGNLPVYMRLTIDGARVEMPAKRECDPAKWNKQAERVIGNKEEARILNNYLDALQSQVYQAEKNYCLTVILLLQMQSGTRSPEKKKRLIPSLK